MMPRETYRIFPASMGRRMFEEPGSARKHWCQVEGGTRICQSAGGRPWRRLLSSSDCKGTPADTSPRAHEMLQRGQPHDQVQRTSAWQSVATDGAVGAPGYAHRRGEEGGR